MRGLKFVTSLVCAVGILAGTAALGQGRGGFAGGGPGFMMGGMMSAIGPVNIDPTQNTEAQLLLRDDVRRALLLDGDQQVKLNALLQTSTTTTNTAVMNARQQTFRQMFQQNGQNMRSMSPQDRQAMFQQAQQKVQQAVSKITDGQAKALEAVLTPSQVARLHQIDYQWRTQLALANQDLAKSFSLTPDQTTKVAQQLRSYQRDQMTAIRQMMQSVMPPPPNGASVGSMTPQQRRQYFTQRMTEMTQQLQQHQGELKAEALKIAESLYEKRVTYGKAVLALLNADQQKLWSGLVGSPFYFNPNTTMVDLSAQSGQ